MSGLGVGCRTALAWGYQSMCRDCGAALPLGQTCVCGDGRDHGDLVLILDRFELRGILGKGAAGPVYRAYDIRLNRSVALRQISKSVVMNEMRFEELRRAVSVMANLEHPHCVEIYALHEQPDRPLLVMEYVPGPSLKTLLNDGSVFDPRSALAILAGALEGLSYTHEQGVAHGKLTPSNVLLMDDGSSKITDVGIGSGRKRSAHDLGYLAPEDLNGSVATIAGDIYALGAALFAMTAGYPPFESGSRRAALEARNVVPELPSHSHPVISGLVEASMQPDPAERPQSAEDFLIQLEVAARASFGPDWRRVGQASVDGAASAAITASQLFVSQAPAAAQLFAATATAGSAAVPTTAAFAAALGGAKVIAGASGAAVVGAVGAAALGAAAVGGPVVDSVVPRQLTSIVVEGSSHVGGTMTVSGACGGTVTYNYALNIAPQQVPFDAERGEYVSSNLRATGTGNADAVSLSGIACQGEKPAKLPASLTWGDNYNEKYRLSLGSSLIVEQILPSGSSRPPRSQDKYGFGIPFLARAVSPAGPRDILSCVQTGALGEVSNVDNAANCQLQSGKTVTLTLPVAFGPDFCYFATPQGHPDATAVCNVTGEMTIKIRTFKVSTPLPLPSASAPPSTPGETVPPATPSDTPSRSEARAIPAATAVQVVEAPGGSQSPASSSTATASG